MNFLAIVNAAYTLVTEVSANTAFPVADVRRWINEAYREITQEKDWPFLVKDAVLPMAYTACSDAGTSTGTTLFVDSALNMYEGQHLVVNAGSVYEEREIDSIDGTEITLVSPGLRGSYSDGDIVSGMSVEKPDDFHKLIYLGTECIDGTTQETDEMIRVSERDVRILYPRMSMGTPRHYFERGNSIFCYPAPDQAFDLRMTYLYTAADLVSDGDVPVFPGRYHHILAIYAAAQCFAKDENMGMFSQKMAEYTAERKKMKDDYNRMYDGLLNMERGDVRGLPGFRL